MTLMRVAAVNGLVLTYDTDDVEDFHVATPNDFCATGVTARGYIKREFAQQHLDLHIDFKPGKKAMWVDQAEAARPDLSKASGMLTAALDAEGVPEELASRIYNRFFFGDPRGFVTTEDGSPDD